MTWNERSAQSRYQKETTWATDGHDRGARSESPGEATADGPEPARVRLPASALEHEPHVRERTQVFGHEHADAKAGELQRDLMRDAVGENSFTFGCDTPRPTPAITYGVSSCWDGLKFSR